MSIQTAVKRIIKKGGNKIFGPKIELFSENLAFRISLETLLTIHTIGKSPTELFYGITDDFWYWLNTEGSRKNSVLRNILPGIADENTQKMFTGDTGQIGTRFLFLYTVQE